MKRTFVIGTLLLSLLTLTGCSGKTVYVPKVELEVVKPPAHLIEDVAIPEYNPSSPATNGDLLEWAIQLHKFSERLLSDRASLRQIYANDVKE